MEEEDTIIIKVIFKFEDSRLYTFDVDRTTTLYETKKILANAAHILKNSFILFHEGQEVTKDHDSLALYKIFPTLKKIEFFLKLKKSEEEVDENEHEKISVKYNIRQPCKEHIGKFPLLYCLTCKKSICNECFSESHNNHEVEEKADYLMPAKILMERIFANSFMFKSDPKLSHYMSCVSFRSIIKTDIFDRLRHLINELENKTINCLEFFSFNEDSTEKNNDLNLDLLKKYCTASFIKLKNNNDIKDILINDEMFLTLYNKLKAIKEYEINYFTENLNKYKAINTFFLPFTQEIKNMSNDINNILLRYINKDIYAKFKEDVARNVVDVVQKEDVIRFMFENVNVPKTKLGANSALMKTDENNMNKSSLTPNMTQRLLPSILLLNEQKNNVNSISNNMATNSKQNTNFTMNIGGSNINTMNNVNNIGTMNNVNAMSTMNNVNNISSMNNVNNINTLNNVNTMSTMNNITTSTMNNITTSTMSNVNNVNTMNNNTSVNLSKNFQQVKDANLVITSPIHFSQTRASNFTTINPVSTMNNSLLNNNININNNPSILANTNNNIGNMNSILNNNVTSCSNVTTTINNNAMNSAKSSKKSNTNVTSNNTNNIILLQSGEKDSEKQKQDKSDIMEIEETQNSPNQKKQELINYSEAKIEEIKANLSEKNTLCNNCSSPIMKKTLINIHLSPNKRDDNFDNRSVILSQNYLQQQQKTLFAPTNSIERKSVEIATTTTQTKIETHTTNVSNIKNSINNVSIFNGKLIDILNKEKEKDNNITTTTNMELELNKDNNKEEKTLSQKAEHGSSSKQNNFSGEDFIHLSQEKDKDKEKDKEKEKETEIQPSNPHSNPPYNYFVSFMYPVFKSNIVKGAVDKNTVQEIKINFNGEVNEFVQGGAYCNYENCLYYSGGQEYIKDAGKLFFVVKRNDLGQNATKLPEMKYPHWNHSMIADKGKIYVIGGYASNKCEVFDISSNTWSELPDLIEKERQRSMLFVDKNYLYCFMGRNQKELLNTVERINLDNVKAGWESIIVDMGKERINLRFYGAGIIKKNNSNKIFFIGGKKQRRNKEEGFKRSIYEFCFDDYKMVKSDFKIENDLVFIENKLFSMDETDCGNFINVGNGFLISMPNLQ